MTTKLTRRDIRTNTTYQFPQETMASAKKRVRKKKVQETGSPFEQLNPTPQLYVNTGNWMNRLVIGHPMTGNVRVEWMMGRMGQTIPCNWGHMDIVQFMSPAIPLKYQVADAENLIAKSVIESNSEWLLFWEHDNIPPPDALVKLNEYMLAGKVPVVGGLYFTKTEPPEPLVYRGIGTSYFDKWRMGDKVWCSGLPFGFTLIHASLIKAMWEESPEYIVTVGGQNTVTRRVFESPQKSISDPARGAYASYGGTSDLAWCQRVVDGNYFEKAGWPKYKNKKYPFLIDTSIYVRHIDPNGIQYPIAIPMRFAPKGKPREIR